VETLTATAALGSRFVEHNHLIKHMTNEKIFNIKDAKHLTLPMRKSKVYHQMGSHIFLTAEV
jgi:hypothetical protein